MITSKSPGIFPERALGPSGQIQGIETIEHGDSGIGFHLLRIESAGP